MPRSHGFTLVELMVTIAVLAILASIAVPGFQSIIQHNRATAMANELSAAIQYARSEAIRRGTIAVTCPNNDDWQTGWSVHAESCQTAALRAWEAAPEHTNISGPNDPITFDGLGSNTSGSATFNISSKNCTGERAREVRVAPGGHIHVQRVNC